MACYPTLKVFWKEVNFLHILCFYNKTFMKQYWFHKCLWKASAVIHPFLFIIQCTRVHLSLFLLLVTAEELDLWTRVSSGNPLMRYRKVAMPHYAFFTLNPLMLLHFVVYKFCQGFSFKNELSHRYEIPDPEHINFLQLFRKLWSKYFSWSLVSRCSLPFAFKVQ